MSKQIINCVQVSDFEANQPLANNALVVFFGTRISEQDIIAHFGLPENTQFSRNEYVGVLRQLARLQPRHALMITCPQ